MANDAWLEEDKIDDSEITLDDEEITSEDEVENIIEEIV